MNKFTAFTIVILTGALVGSAATNAVAKTGKNPYLALTGGLIKRPGVAEGRFVILNAQQSVASTNFAALAKYFSTHLKIKAVVREIKALANPKDAQKAFVNDGANFGVVVIDNADCDMALSVYPEKRFAVVNVNGVRTKNCTNPYLVARTRKEITRAILFIAGGGSSQRSLTNLMGPVMNPEDLDHYDDSQIPVDVMARCLIYLPASGCNVNTYVPYRKACMEGWAPAPTNDYQRAIWDKVHEPPTKPLKITYDKDKQKPVVK